MKSQDEIQRIINDRLKVIGKSVYYDTQAKFKTLYKLDEDDIMAIFSQWILDDFRDYVEDYPEDFDEHGYAQACADRFIEYAEKLKGLKDD